MERHVKATTEAGEDAPPGDVDIVEIARAGTSRKAARFSKTRAGEDASWATVAEDIQRRAPELLRAVREGVQEYLPELNDVDPEVAAMCHRALGSNVQAGTAHLRTRSSHPGAPPVHVVQLARMWARRGMPVERLMRIYMAGQRTALYFVIDAVASSDLPLRHRREATVDVTRAVLSYAKPRFCSRSSRTTMSVSDETPHRSCGGCTSWRRHSPAMTAGSSSATT